MCGVVGYSSTNPNQDDINLLKQLIVQSKIRGLHSFGYSYVYKGELKHKKYFDYKEVNFPITDKIIYHNRYSTSGDYKVHHNNQPIYNDTMSMVFNGVIDMRTKNQMEEHYNIKMKTDNDGEIILQKYANDKFMLKEFISNMKGSFAGLFLNEQKILCAIRNENRPLYKLERNNSVFFASTRDIFKRVDKKLQPEILESNKIYEY